MATIRDYAGEPEHPSGTCNTVDFVRVSAADLDRLRYSVSTLCDAMESMLPLIRLLTVRQVIQAGDGAINAVGLNPWCISEGLATGDEFVSVSKFERAIREARGE